MGEDRGCGEGPRLGFTRKELLLRVRRRVLVRRLFRRCHDIIAATRGGDLCGIRAAEHDHAVGALAVDVNGRRGHAREPAALPAGRCGRAGCLGLASLGGGRSDGRHLCKTERGQHLFVTCDVIEALKFVNAQCAVHHGVASVKDERREGRGRRKCEGGGEGSSPILEVRTRKRSATTDSKPTIVPLVNYIRT